MSRALFLGIKGNKGWLLSGSSALPREEHCQTRTRPRPQPLPVAPPHVTLVGPLAFAESSGK